ncbi:hypothetical protein ABZ611_06925 [Streptomyces sp. NPDC007861]|uniref:hypothetical protein n=1 Tax=Streptomyces sp. NPDC007861 TaxID=3154893 RepID=UPI0033F05B9F
MTSPPASAEPSTRSGKVTYNVKKFDIDLKADGTISRTAASDADRRRLVMRQDIESENGEPKILLEMGNAIEDLAPVQFADVTYACAVNAPKGKLTLVRAADGCLRNCFPERGCQKGAGLCASQRTVLDPQLDNPVTAAHSRAGQLLAVAGRSDKKVSLISTRQVDAHTARVNPIACCPEFIQFSPDGTSVMAAAPADKAIVVLMLPASPLRGADPSGDITQERINLSPDPGFMGPSWLSVSEMEVKGENGQEIPERKQYVVTALCPDDKYTKAQAFTVLMMRGSQGKPEVKITKSGDAANPAVEADMKPFVSSQIAVHCVELP